MSVHQEGEKKKDTLSWILQSWSRRLLVIDRVLDRTAGPAMLEPIDLGSDRTGPNNYHDILGTNNASTCTYVCLSN